MHLNSIHNGDRNNLNPIVDGPVNIECDRCVFVVLDVGVLDDLFDHDDFEDLVFNV